MIGLTPVDRWTCPTCHVTEVPNAGDAAMQRALRRAQERHATQHNNARAAARKAAA